MRLRKPKYTSVIGPKFEEVTSQIKNVKTTLLNCEVPNTIIISVSAKPRSQNTITTNSCAVS
jgi:hypothetical protein